MKDNNKKDKIEGDINISEERKKWNNSITNPEIKYWLEKDERFFLHQSLSTPCLDVLTDSKDAYFINIEGKKYYDFHGNSVHQIGYSNEFVINNLVEQLKSLTFSPRRFTNIPAIQFAEKLASLAPEDLNRVLLTPGGSSAVSIALKLARAITGKSGTISFTNSFHGANLDTISIGGEEQFKRQMGNLFKDVFHIDFPKSSTEEVLVLEHLEKLISLHFIGAFIAEVIRNTEVFIPTKHFWQEAKKICENNNVIFIDDEIPLALGRTGKMFAFEHFDITPDVICLGKGLGGGIFPQAAIITRDKYNNFKDISLGHYTHEKSPLGSKIGLATIEFIEKNKVLQNVKQLENLIAHFLHLIQKKYTFVKQVRGIGLLWAIEIESKSQFISTEDLTDRVMYGCLKDGLNFKITSGTVIQLMPALTITEIELVEAMEILERNLEMVSNIL